MAWCLILFDLWNPLWPVRGLIRKEERAARFIFATMASTLSSKERRKKKEKGPEKSADIENLGGLPPAYTKISKFAI